MDRKELEALLSLVKKFDAHCTKGRIKLGGRGELGRIHYRKLNIQFQEHIEKEIDGLGKNGGESIITT